MTRHHPTAANLEGVTLAPSFAHASGRRRRRESSPSNGSETATSRTRSGGLVSERRGRGVRRLAFG
jgi:hypothetical protein